MSVKYPRTTVWYIECRSSRTPIENGRPNTSGSGVSIWLKKRESDSHGTRYILTCQHVVREGNVGALLDDIRVWQPGAGFTGHTEAKRACISSIKALQEVWPKDAQIPANDWVLLEVDDEEFSQSAECIRKVSSPSLTWNSVIGYPGGAAAWSHGSIVEPISSGGFRRLAAVDAAIHLLGSEEAAEGMSGGGLFSFLGAFVGLHRSTMQKGIVKRSVSAGHIRRQLSALGYDIVEPGALPVPIRFALRGACVLFALMFLIAIESGKIGDPCESTSLLGRMQRKYSTLNLHWFNRHLNGTIAIEHSFVRRVRCYQTVTIKRDVTVTDNIFVERGGTLIIAKGSVVRFAGATGIECYGRLLIEGEQGTRVTMTDHGDERWSGIFLSGDGAEQSSITHCDFSRGSGSRVTLMQDVYKSIENPKGNTPGEIASSFVPPPLHYGGNDRKRFGGVLCVYGTADISLTNTTFRDNISESGGAVYLYSSERCLFDACIFENNRAIPLVSKTAKPPGGAVSLQHSSSVTFRNCIFRRNAALGKFSCGGAVSVGFRSSVDFMGSTLFAENVASNVGGAIYCLSMRPQFGGGVEVSDAAGFSRKVRVVDCSFVNNRALLSVSYPKAPWADNGHAVAVDAGCNVSMDRCDFTHLFSKGRLLHIDVGDDQSQRGEVRCNYASLSVTNSTFKVADPQSAVIEPFVDSRNRVFVTLRGNEDEVSKEGTLGATSGLAGISDHLMPEAQLVSGKMQKYQRARKAGVTVDTVVIHHVSAINWEGDKSLDAGVKERTEKRLTETGGKRGPFSPERCRAIFESYGVSAHYLITRDGEIWRLVPHSAIAFHAGESVMPSPPDRETRENVNEFSLGIELIAVHPSEYGNFPDPQDRGYTEIQYAVLRDLLCYLSSQFTDRGVPTLSMVVGHDEIAGESIVKAGRRRGPPKTDPGPDFIWKNIRHDDFTPILDIR